MKGIKPNPVVHPTCELGVVGDGHGCVNSMKLIGTSEFLRNYLMSWTTNR